MCIGRSPPPHAHTHRTVRVCSTCNEDKYSPRLAIVGVLHNSQTVEHRRHQTQLHAHASSTNGRAVDAPDVVVAGNRWRNRRTAARDGRSLAQLTSIKMGHTHTHTQTRTDARLLSKDEQINGTHTEERHTETPPNTRTKNPHTICFRKALPNATTTDWGGVLSAVRWIRCLGVFVVVRGNGMTLTLLGLAAIKRCNKQEYNNRHMSVDFSIYSDSRKIIILNKYIIYMLFCICSTLQLLVDLPFCLYLCIWALLFSIPKKKLRT